MERNNPVGKGTGDEAYAKQLQTILDRTKIRNDKKEVVDFTGEDKDFYVESVKKALPIANDSLKRFYVEMGRHLCEVKDSLIKKKLYTQYLHDISVGRGTAHNVCTLWKVFGEKVGDYFHLSVRKLLTIAANAKDKDPKDFCEKHEDFILKASLEALRKKLDVKTGDDNPTYAFKFEVGGCSVTGTKNGKSIRIEVPGKEYQGAIAEALKGVIRGVLASHKARIAYGVGPDAAQTPPRGGTSGAGAAQV